MAQKRQKTKKGKVPVAIDEQNPASTHVKLLVESLVKRKLRKKAKAVKTSSSSSKRSIRD